jgi:ABC-type multidrug transport system ATPase subunit/pSer/pThr/pTyr-binding forkhead associated (FHA) protein/ABC-type multidrug transport system permease subunit
VPRTDGTRVDAGRRQPWSTLSAPAAASSTGTLLIVTGRTGITGWLEIGGERLDLPDGRPVCIGRDPDCDVRLDDDRVSWRHACVGLTGERVEVWDLGSRNGTFLDGLRLEGEAPLEVRDGARLRIGATTILFRDPARPPEHAAHGAARLRRYGVDSKLRIGRDADNDIVLDAPSISRAHAVIVPGDPPTVRDLGSRNGTRVGEERVRTAALAPGTEVGIGPFRLRCDGASVTVADDRVGMHLRARDVSMTVADGKTILCPTSVSVAPGEFVALIGQSGSGKTTLLKALAGISTPTGGEVLLNDDPVSLRQTDIGYVPQSETVHERLTVHEALTYAAKLRLPSDTSAAEIARVVEDALRDLRLTEHAGTRVGELSGGQRKRAATAAELLSKPTMLLLDEPTSGLDPALERLLMELLRDLADQGRGVVVVTHATASLDLCDTVAVMGRGGQLRFLGSPQDALTHFEVDAFDGIYRILDQEPPAQPTHAPQAPARRPPRAPGLAGRSFFHHLGLVGARYGRTMLRDRRTLVVLIGQAPVLAVICAGLFARDLFVRPDQEPSKSASLLFVLVTLAVWMGLISSCREVVKERSIVMRELSVGVRLDAYLAAKAVVLFALTTVQVLVALAIVVAMRPIHEPIGNILQLAGVLLAVTWVAVAHGLVISTLARSEDQATSFVPLLLMPQLVFAGSVIPVEQMSPVTQRIADLVFTRWAYDGAGATIDMATRLTEDSRFAPINQYGDFFGTRPGATGVVLAGFFGAFMLGAGWILARRAALKD